MTEEHTAVRARTIRGLTGERYRHLRRDDAPAVAAGERTPRERRRVRGSRRRRREQRSHRGQPAGADATWLSKVPETALGRRVVSELRGHGIQTDVVWSHRGRQGTYYLEQAGKPRGTNVVYDRENTAVATAEARELNIDRIQDAQVFFTHRDHARALLDAQRHDVEAA